MSTPERPWTHNTYETVYLVSEEMDDIAEFPVGSFPVPAVGEFLSLASRVNGVSGQAMTYQVVRREFHIEEATREADRLTTLTRDLWLIVKSAVPDA